MVFSSLVFLCVVLPAVLILYAILPGIRAKNVLLLVASLLFYAYGEPVYVLLLIVSAALNYFAARMLARGKGSRGWLAVAVIFNLGILCIFKYAGFLVESFDALTGLAVPVPQIRLPVGISFFTFQAMSYVIDVYRDETPVQRNFGRLLLYISFFPQLIAGPIVKYRDIAEEIDHREQSAEQVARGMVRFLAGLAKKVMIANVMAVVADSAFGVTEASVNILTAWTGAAAYMLQIYFDFSGYSDMAIGLGWMFGFHFKENFRYPYCASSIREFWRRWHISLSGWFRDYLYIPLGGNRRGRARTCLNRMLVFVCTGIWHGANVTFLFWGLFHGCFQLLEEFVPVFQRPAKGWRRVVRHLYTLLVVLVGFVFFRAETLGQGLLFVRQMMTGFHFEPEAMRLWWSWMTPLNLGVFAVGVLGSMPVKQLVEQKKWYPFLTAVASLAGLLLCLLNLAGGTYNPFIYFRF